VADTHEPREVMLKSHGVTAAGQPEIERGIDQVHQLIGIEGAARASHRASRPV